ncbi:MAG TPA: HAD family hydrolase [Candidatus Acidoferrum sp.]|nr:HAD family hydrolase [Candidatus Acidoferrum sp.]
MPVEAVLFDLFDTLLLLENSEVYYTPSLKKLHEFLNRNGIRIPFEDFRRVYFEIRDRFYSESRQTLEEPHFNVRVSQTLQRFGYNLDVCDPIVTGATMAFADEFMHYVHLDNEAAEVLQNLKGKYKLGVVSNFAIPECGFKLLSKFGLRGFFDVVVISGEVNRRKPSAEIFEKALKALNVDASHTIFVGDMLDLDIKGPKNVGMKTVLIQRKPVELVSDANPDWIIKRLDELLPLLSTVE